MPIYVDDEMNKKWWCEYYTANEVDYNWLDALKLCVR